MLARDRQWQLAMATQTSNGEKALGEWEGRHNMEGCSDTLHTDIFGARGTSFREAEEDTLQ